MIRDRNASLKRTTLKSLAEHVGLSIGTISLVLNHAPQSISIPQHTKDRIFAAARALDYRPNPVARALRTSTDLADHGLRALVFAGAKEFARALDAIRQAGLRVPGTPW